MRSIMRNGLVPGGFSTKTGRQAVFFTVVNPMDDEQGLREAFLRFIKSKNRASQEYLETTSGHGILVQFLARSRRRTAILPNKVQCGRPPWNTVCRVHCESDMHEKYRTALTKRKRKTTCCSRSKFAMWITRSTQTRSKIISGKHKAMHRASGKPDATLWITEFQAYPSQQFNSRMNKDNIQLPSWSRSSNHISTKNNISKIWVRRRKSTGSVKHRKIAARYEPYRDLRTLCEFYETSMLRLQLFHRNWNNVLQLWTKFEDFAESHNIFNRTTAISIRSLATSLRRIPVKDQSMANLRDKWCSSRRKTCWEKQRREEESSDNSLQVESTTKLLEFVGGARDWRERNHALRPKMLWRKTTFQLRKLNEYKIQSIGFSR